MSTAFRFIYILLVFALLMTSCVPQAKAVPTIVDVENAVETAPTATKKPTVVPSYTQVENKLDVPVILTDTPIPTPTDMLTFIGTSLPEEAEIISVDNFLRLKRVGQWGRGSIQGVGFAPDGKSFIVASELGWSIYKMDALDQPPQWVGFGEPTPFSDFYFSTDGTIVRLNPVYKETVKLKSFPSAGSPDNLAGIKWREPDVMFDYDRITLRSPDGSKIFKSGVDFGYFEDVFSEERTVREMFDANSNLLYSFKDDVPYVTYSDRNGPEGCDLSVFSPCGNALMALATAPVKALFSDDGKTLAVLYAVHGYGSGVRDFSHIRIYDSSNGDLIGSLGGFSKPVQDFDYSPDGKLLLAGYVDGTVSLWDIPNQNMIFGARHMNSSLQRIEYSKDSKFLLIQRGDELEVRLTKDGSLVSRYDAVEFAISPKGNLFAIGDSDGNIQIRDIDTGKGIRSIKAHDDRIYSIAFSPDGIYLASSGRDCNIKLWDLASGKLLHYFEETVVDAYEIDYPSRIFSTYLEFVPNRNMLIGFGSWGTVVNWNVNSGATNYVIQSSALEYYNGMMTLKPHFPEYFSVDDSNGQFFINEVGFNLLTGRENGAYQPPSNLPDGCAPVGPQSIDKQLLFTIGYDTHSGEICILNFSTLELLGTLYAPWGSWPYLSPDGSQLIVPAGGNIFYVYQVVN